MLVVMVFAASFTVFYRAPVRQMIDSRYLAAVSHALLHTGQSALSDDLVPPQRVARNYQLREMNGKIHHFYPVAPALLNVPVVAAFEVLGISPVRADGSFNRHHENRILKLAAALVAAAICSVLYGLGRLFLRPPATLGLVAAFALGTQIYSTVSRAFWSHGWAVLLLAAGLYVLIARRPAIGRLTMIVAATLLSWSFFSRPTMSLSILAITALLFHRRERYLPTFVATGLAWATLLVWRSMTLFGTVLPDYFSQSNYQLGHEAAALVGNYPTAALGTLVSPGRGLFIFVPFFAWILGMVFLRRRALSEPALAFTSITVIVAHWQLLSFFGHWTGGQSFGPRLFSDVIVWFFVLGALVLQAHAAAPLTRGKRYLAHSLLGVALAVSLFINHRGATAWATWNWRSFERPPTLARNNGEPLLRPAGIWNWRYPQFMAGLLPIEQELKPIGRRRRALRKGAAGETSDLPSGQEDP